LINFEQINFWFVSAILFLKFSKKFLGSGTKLVVSLTRNEDISEANSFKLFSAASKAGLSKKGWLEGEELGGLEWMWENFSFRVYSCS